jgi:predicted dehydrogenase
MTVKIGLIGIGFMGKCHFESYAGIPGAKVVALCDIDKQKLSGDWSGIAGNIGGAGQKVNLKGIRLYTQARQLFADPNVDVVDITLPTYLHARTAIAALQAGKHVICEKSMARTSAEAKRMVAAAKKARRQLFVAHCIRFWPQYAKAAEIVQSGAHGKVLSAIFTRVSPTPTWSWKNWLMQSRLSGDAALDLHIHDADYILYAFGAPRRVTTRASGFERGRADHVVTTYDYGPNMLVMAEGAWDYAPRFPFGMSFRIVMEKATLDCPTNLQMMLHPKKGKSVAIPCAAASGYQVELRHFVDCLAKRRKSNVVSPASALASVKLIEAEVKAAKCGKPVSVRL